MSIGKILDLPPGYREVETGEVVRASDVEGDGRTTFTGWKAVREWIVGKPFCKCWGVQVLRDTR